MSVYIHPFPHTWLSILGALKVYYIPLPQLIFLHIPLVLYKSLCYYTLPFLSNKPYL
jgi:hypothetical protein